MPPPFPPEWLPEMVLAWMTVWRELGVLLVRVMPPPSPAAPAGLLVCVALLVRTWLPLIDMRAFWLTQIPPAVAATPAVVSTAELFWTILLVKVTRPLLGATKLKMAIPPPLPLVVLQESRVTLVSVRLASPLEPVSNSMQPPSPSLP